MDGEHSESIKSSSEPIGNVPNDSEGVRQDSEVLGSFPNQKERTENHVLTVRQTARMFEDAGVARTERSIINWCHINKQGVGRLDCYYDPNEGKFFIFTSSRLKRWQKIFPYSFEVLFLSVAILQDLTIFSLSNIPKKIFVFPMSTVKSMA